jgi:hypothetical protein
MNKFRKAIWLSRSFLPGRPHEWVPCNDVDDHEVAGRAEDDHEGVEADQDVATGSLDPRLEKKIIKIDNFLTFCIFCSSAVCQLSSTKWLLDSSDAQLAGRGRETFDAAYILCNSTSFWGHAVIALFESLC